jgi:uncharacterized protein (DUF1330 family)
VERLNTIPSFPEFVMINRRVSLLSALVLVLASVVVAKALHSSTIAPKAYGIAEINVTDMQAYRQYIAAVSPIVEEFGGRYLVRAGTVVPIEGDAPTGRFIVIEFPSLAVAKAFEASPQYLKIAPLRQKASQGRVFLVEGAPQP